MATIGLDKLYYASISEDPTSGEETYAAPKPLAKAISAELSVEVAEAILYADDGASEIVKEFKSGTLTLGVDDLGAEAAAALTGARLDANGVLISTSEDGGTPVAIGFRAARSNGKYQYFWLYHVKFARREPHWQPKLIRSRSLPRVLRERSCGVTNQTLPASTRGKLKSPKERSASSQKPLLAGTPRCMSLPLQPALNRQTTRTAGKP